MRKQIIFVSKEGFSSPIKNLIDRVPAAFSRKRYRVK